MNIKKGDNLTLIYRNKYVAKSGADGYYSARETVTQQGRKEQMKLTLVNDFHRTSVNLVSKDERTLSPRQVKRARKALCGIDGCTCGGDLGERGNNPVIWVNPNTGVAWIQS